MRRVLRELCVQVRQTRSTCGGIKRSSRIQVDAECIIIYSACNQPSLWSSSFCLYSAADDEDPVVADYLGWLAGYETVVKSLKKWRETSIVYE